MIISRPQQKADDTTQGKLGFLHALFPPRYARLTAIIFGLLVCLSILFGIQYYFASKHNQLAVQIDILSKLNGNIRKISLTGTSPSSTHQAILQIDALEQEMNHTEPLFHALQNGGTVEGIKVKALSKDIIQGEWQPILATWQAYRSNLKKDAANAHNTANGGIFRNFAEYARFHDSQLQAYFDKVNLTLVNYARQAANISRIMAVLGVLMMISSFGIYIYLVRHLGFA